MGPSLWWWWWWCVDISVVVYLLICARYPVIFFWSQHFRRLWLLPNRAVALSAGAKATGQRGHERAERQVWAE